MKVTFRCKRSGNTVSFTDEADIAGLRTHDGYEEVKDEKIEAKEESHTVGRTKEKEVLKTTVKRGRPAKK